MSFQTGYEPVPAYRGTPGLPRSIPGSPPPSSALRLRSGYTHLHTNMSIKPGPGNAQRLNFSQLDSCWVGGGGGGSYQCKTHTVRLVLQRDLWSLGLTSATGLWRRRPCLQAEATWILQLVIIIISHYLLVYV